MLLVACSHLVEIYARWSSAECALLCKIYWILRIVAQKDLWFTKIYNGIYGVVYEIYSLLRTPCLAIS